MTAGPRHEEDDLPDFGPDVPAVDAESRQAYIENLLVVAADDAKNVTLISTVAVGAVAFAAKELAGPLSHETVILKLLGLLAATSLLAGAVLFYFYAAAITHTRMGLVRRIVSRTRAAHNASGPARRPGSGGAKECCGGWGRSCW